MKVFECNSIAEAHMQLVNFVMWNKSNVMTEDNQQTYEAPPVTVTIKQPLKDMIHSKSTAQLQFCEAYADQILNGTKNDFDYTYHDRLFDYCQQECNTNQIKECISKLISSPTTRRAIAITWIPVVDNYFKNVPCLQFIQFKINKEKLDMYVLFRSEDILGAFGQNAYGMAKLQEYVAKRIECNIGIYEHIVTTPHLYPIENDSELKRFLA